MKKKLKTGGISMSKAQKMMEESLNRDYEQFLSMDTLRKKELYLESVIITANGLLELYKDLQNEKESD